jgi:lipid-A-disaccharide synthase
MPAPDSKRIYLVAGEASGDLLTAPLVNELRRINPDLRFRGVGGGHLQQAGVTLFRHHQEITVMGLTEVLRRWQTLSRALKQIEQDIRDFRPDLLILVDFPGFNLTLARRLRDTLPSIVYYISPKFWAWRYKRVKKLARLTDLVACIFPFEPAHIERAGGRAVYEGHPLVDLVDADLDRETFFKEYHLKPEQKLITIFPGSRDQEVAQLLPPALEAVRELKQSHPQVQFAVHLASTQLAGRYTSTISRAGLIPFSGNSHNAMSHSDYAAVASGTANLETALSGTPQLMYYRFHPFTWKLARRLVKLDFASPVNIVLEREAIPELLQDSLTERLIAEIDSYLRNPETTDEKYASEYAELSERLGTRGVIERLAEKISPFLNQADEAGQ